MPLALMALLGTNQRPEKKQDRGYELERLRRRDLAWIYPANSGIAAVWVKALRLSSKATDERLTLEGTKEGTVHRAYERLTGPAQKPGRVDPQSVNVTQAQIRVEYAPQGGKLVGPRDITLTWPNSCNLGQDQRDHVLREMLINSGIDPEAIGRDTVR